MKNKLTRVLTDDSGKCYRFKNYEFKMELDKKAKSGAITKQLLQEKIAERAFVSLDTVKKWYKCENGPSNIESVKACADVLDINYNRLLYPLLNEDKINEYEIQLVEKVYQMCVAIVYDFQRVSCKVKQNLPDKPKDINTQEDLVSYASNRIIDVFQVVDQSSLRTSLLLRDKLQKLLFQIRLLFSEDWKKFPDEWIEILDELDKEGTRLPSSGITRKHFILYDFEGKKRIRTPESPLCGETIYAERIGLDRYILSMEVGDNLDENDEDNPNNEDVFLATHGVSRDYPVDPGTLYIDGMVRFLKKIFILEFPNVFKENTPED